MLLPTDMASFGDQTDDVLFVGQAWLFHYRPREAVSNIRISDCALRFLCCEVLTLRTDCIKISAMTASWLLSVITSMFDLGYVVHKLS